MGETSSSLDVRIVDTVADFATRGEAWERLQQQASTTSIFASFDWQYLWWTHYHQGRPLRLLWVTDGDTLVGILPLYVDTLPMLGYPVRVLRFVGTGGDTVPDDLGPVLLAGREREAARVLAEAVLRLPDWDVLLFTDMEPACPFFAEMQRCARAAWMAPLAGRCERIAYAELPATFDEWLQSLHRDRRQRIRSLRKKIDAAHPTRFFVWTDAATLDQGIDRLIHLHRKRWQGAGQSHGFSSEQYVGFHRVLMHECLARDRLRLYCLDLGGEIAAIYYFYRFRDRVYLMQSGFDPDHADVKPGQALLGYVFESAIGEGHQVLDFLRGQHRYKDELKTGERETVGLTAFRPRLGALVYQIRRRLLPLVKAQARQVWGRLRPAGHEAKP